MQRLDLLNSHILVVDDQDANIRLLDQLLASEGYQNVYATTSSSEGLERILSGWPDLVLLDLQMPQPDGFEILKQMRANESFVAKCPILVFTADDATETRRHALRCGASDFLAKPGDMVEILLRVRNFLELRKLQKDLEATNRTLEEKVIERTEDLWEANVEVVHRLARAAEYRDDQTGGHINRVAELTHKIAVELGVPDGQAEIIRLAAPLHDVGKIALADSILLKQGPLTETEREIMKRHTIIGAGILAHGKSELLRVAEIIALTHHERWDGMGYPYGLSKDAIPLVGRILAVADVFDALISERPYKEAWARDRAIAEIEKGASNAFDPQVVEAGVAVLRREQPTPAYAAAGRAHDPKSAA